VRYSALSAGTLFEKTEKLGLVQSVGVENYDNREKSLKSTKFGIHVLGGILNKFGRGATGSVLSDPGIRGSQNSNQFSFVVTGLPRSSTVQSVAN